MKRFLGLTCAALIVISGCGVANQAIDAAAGRAAQRTGETVGDAVGQRVGEMAAGLIMAQFPANWNAQWMSLYVNYLFSVAFHSGSYAVVEDAYDPGEWTRWVMLQNEEETGAIVERAFLNRTDDNEEWWRVRYVNTEDDEEIVLEGLFAPDRSTLVRLRAQFPGEEAKELPVQENTYSYVQPIQLTEESLEAATQGVEQVAVPAGSFQATRVEYGSAGATLEWWLHDGVPGELVKYSSRSDNGEQSDDAVPETWTVELDDYGDGAEPELEVD